MDVDAETLQDLVDELRPWHYCQQLPHGIVTGTSQPDRLEKLELMTAAGAWPKPEYERVLDLGSNSGLIPMFFADRKGSIVTAAEFQEKTYKQLCLAVSVRGYTDRVIPWFKNIREGDYGENEYDFITFLGTLHHCGVPSHGVIFGGCFTALKAGAGIAVQTRPDQFVSQKLRQAGFCNVHKLDGYQQEGRFAWLATKP